MFQHLPRAFPGAAATNVADRRLRRLESFAFARRGVARLYLFEKFFSGKATEELLGLAIKPEYLNDDRLGDVLEELYESGLSEVFLEISLQAALRFGVKQEIAHLDSEKLSADKALREYKAQQGVERGFRFLKDPLFFASSVFLKSPKRRR